MNQYVNDFTRTTQLYFDDLKKYNNDIIEKLNEL